MKTLNLNRSKIISLFLIVIIIVTCISNISVFAVNDISTTNSIDQMLLKSQQWLNNNYSGKTGFVNVPEDGTSRRSTVNGCIRALQIELGITDTATNFGQGTISLFNSQYPNGIIEQDYPSNEEKNIYGIIQCALWTKGYSTGVNIISKHFYDGTGNAIINLKTDMGFINPNSTVTLNVMKGLLSMDQYVCLSGGNNSIRLVQQSLNRDYEDYIGIIPTDGIYDRKTNKALIIVLQAIEGYSVDEATGNFGQGTKNNLPILPDTNNVLDDTTEQKAIVLLKYILCCNGYDVGFTPYFDSGLYDALCSFQNSMSLNVTGNANVDTWMSLLTSCGNTDRSSIACDTRYEMTQERIDYLKSNGYQIVGRYLTGSSKGLKEDEPQRIIDNGLSFFPIFQETLFTDTISKYNYTLGVSDANTATNKAHWLGIPENNVIYYAIDFDPTDSEIETYVVPYFEAIYANKGSYKVGVYGTRNVCNQIMELGYAETCFVSDMSTGYSGNMGFKIPTNWNLDQYHEYSVTTASGSWDIDKVAYSGYMPVVSSAEKIIPSNSTNYLYGTVSFDGDNIGNWFIVHGNKFKYRIVWDCPDGNDSFHNLITCLQKYHVGNVWWEDTFFGQFEYETDWMNIQDGGKYRFTYNSRNILYNISIPANVTVYVYTIYE